MAQRCDRFWGAPGTLPRELTRRVVTAPAATTLNRVMLYLFLVSAVCYGTARNSAQLGRPTVGRGRACAPRATAPERSAASNSCEVCATSDLFAEANATDSFLLLKLVRKGPGDPLKGYPPVSDQSVVVAPICGDCSGHGTRRSVRLRLCMVRLAAGGSRGSVHLVRAVRGRGIAGSS
jgi:hypothetical protein